MRKTPGFTVQSGTAGCRDRQYSGALLGAGIDSTGSPAFTVQLGRRCAVRIAGMPKCLLMHIRFILHNMTHPPHPGHYTMATLGVTKGAFLLSYVQILRYNNNYSCTVLHTLLLIFMY
jgi:hypothetical protein